MATKRKKQAKRNAKGKANELVIQRVFKAPREQVWKAWTEPERLKRWWGPKGYTTPSWEIDLRVGGRMTYCMRSPEGKDIWGTGVYRQIVPMKKLVCTDSFADEDGNVVPATHYGMTKDFPLEMLVTVTFADVQGGTRMTLRHTGLPAGPDLAGANQGWSESFDKLADALEGDGSRAKAAPRARGFTIVRTLKAPPMKVWEMWTTKGGLEKWFTAEGWTSRVTDLDVRVGGRYEITMSDGKQTIRNHGTYTDVTPPRRLAWTWEYDIFLGPDDEPYDVPITVTFEKVPGGTKMTFTEGPLATAEYTEGSRQGVLANFERLAKALEY